MSPLAEAKSHIADAKRENRDPIVRDVPGHEVVGFIFVGEEADSKMTIAERRLMGVRVSLENAIQNPQLLVVDRLDVNMVYRDEWDPAAPQLTIDGAIVVAPRKMIPKYRRKPKRFTISNLFNWVMLTIIALVCLGTLPILLWMAGRGWLS
ncbi:MAG: hypothetical protein AAFQ71_11510 [Planctomycetota bacterium]